MDQWAKYIGVAGTLALMVTIALIVWVSVGVSVPDPVYSFLGAAWGYYFATNGKAIVTQRKGGSSDVA
jgi:hypothetical protein